MDRILCLLIYLLTGLARLAKSLARLGIGHCAVYTPGEPRKILLVGYSGARNTGSDVRVAAIARQVKQLFGAEQVRLSVLTLDVDNLKGYFDDDVALVKISSFFPWPLFRACLSHHAAILCEGSTLKSTFADALTLFQCEAAGVMAAQGKPCIAYGSEVGEMTPFLRKAAMRLCKDTYFITRTKGSLDALHALGLTGHAGTDAAWSYDRQISGEQADSLLKEQGWDGAKPLLGVAVIDPFCWPVHASLRRWTFGRLTGKLSGQYDKCYFFSDSPARREAYAAYIQGVADGVNAFLANHDCFPVLIGMEKLDAKACRAVADKLGSAAAMFLSGEHAAPVMTGILKRLTQLVTSRYHAAVLSMEHGCRLIAVSMDERLEGIMQELALDTRYLFHTTEQMLGGKIAAALEAAEEHRDEITGTLTAMAGRYHAVLEEMGQFMHTYIEHALQGAER